MAAERGLRSMSSMSVRSSFTRVMGSCASEASDEYPVPKSSSATATPSVRRRCSATSVAGPVWITLSVISTSSASPGRPVTDSASMTWSTKLPSSNCMAETLMATQALSQPMARQALTVEVAERSAQVVSSRIRPVASAISMNSLALAMRPSDLRQRSSASTPTAAIVCSATCGWYISSRSPASTARRNACSRRKRCAATS